MSKTTKHEKMEPREREFPYIPRCVPIVSTGRAYGEDDNMAYVRALLASRQPRFAASVEKVVKEMMNDV